MFQVNSSEIKKIIDTAVQAALVTARREWEAERASNHAEIDGIPTSSQTPSDIASIGISEGSASQLLLGLSGNALELTMTVNKLIEECEKLRFHKVALEDTNAVEKKLHQIRRLLDSYEPTLGEETVSKNRKRIVNALFEKSKIHGLVKGEASVRSALEKVRKLVGYTDGDHLEVVYKRVMSFEPIGSLRVALIELTAMLTELTAHHTQPSVRWIAERVESWLPESLCWSWLRTANMSYQVFIDQLMEHTRTLRPTLRVYKAREYIKPEGTKRFRPDKAKPVGKYPDKKSKEKQIPAESGTAAAEEPEKERSEVVCFLCKEKGHYKNKCPKNRKMTGSLRSRPREVLTGIQGTVMYVDTMAQGNVFADTMIPYVQKLTSRAELYRPGSDEPWKPRKGFIIVDGQRIDGVLDYSNVGVTLIKPTHIDTKAMKCWIGDIEYQMQDTGNAWIITVTPQTPTYKDRRSLTEVIARHFKLPTINEKQVEELVREVHLALGCAKQSTMIKAILAMGGSLPTRIIEYVIAKCEYCEKTTKAPNMDKRVGALMDITREIQSELHVDVMFVQGSEQYVGIAVCKETKSGLVTLDAVKSKAEMKNTIQKAKTRTKVERVVGDAGKENRLDETQGDRVVPVGNKNSNGVAEGEVSRVRKALNAVIKRAAREVEGFEEKDWHLLVPAVEWMLNARLSVHGKFPIQVWTGYNIEWQFRPFRRFLNGEYKAIVLASYAGDTTILSQSRYGYSKQTVPTRKLTKPIVGAITKHRTTKASRRHPQYAQKLREELEKLQKMDVFDNAQPPKGAVVLNAITVCTLNNEQLKVRLAIRGDLDPRDGIETAVQLPNATVRLLGIIKTLGTEIGASDVAKAYYQVPLEEDIWIRLPKGAPHPVVRKIKRVIPGLKEGARLWVQYFKKKMEENGWKETITGIFKKDKEFMMAYMDDLLLAGAPKETYEDIKKHIVLDEYEGGYPEKFVGWSISLIGEELKLSFQAFLDSIDESKWAQHREALGSLNWLATLYPHIKFLAQSWASQAAQNNEMQKEVVAQAKKLVSQLKKKLPTVTLARVESALVRIFADASFNDTTKRASVGVLICLHDQSWPVTDKRNIIYSKSIRVTRRCRSTFSAELEAAIAGIASYVGLKNKVNALWERHDVELITDSRSLYLSTQSNATKDELSTGAFELMMQEATRHHIQMRWVRTQHQKADCLTKEMLNPDIY